MIIGHQKQWNFLKKRAAQGDFSHAYLFCGPEQVGKKKMALEWASLLVGKEMPKFQHPDLLFLESEGKDIQIGQIKELIWSLSLKPYSAPVKVAIIDNANLMNQEAQTSLLKTLEEPKGKSVIILVSQEPEQLLPTILSRVQVLKFYPVSQKEIADYLKKNGISQKEAENVSSLTCGKPGMALDFLADPNLSKKIQQKAQDLNKILGENLPFRFQYAQALSENSEEVKETLKIWLYSARELLMSKIKDSEDSSSIGKLKSILQEIQKTFYLISKTNVNAKLALETLMLSF